MLGSSLVMVEKEELMELLKAKKELDERMKAQSQLKYTGQHFEPKPFYPTNYAVSEFTPSCFNPSHAQTQLHTCDSGATQYE